MTDQPSYFCIANLGDANPFEHGGAFVCIDRRGIYDPILLVYNADLKKRSEVTLEPCHRIQSLGKIVGIGTNKFHTLKAEWWGDIDSLQKIVDFTGCDLSDLVNTFITQNCISRACAYLKLIEYHGIHEFDHDSCLYEYYRDAKKFCDEMLRQIEETKTWKDGYFQI